MARKKCEGTELAVFKGREARLNRAILNVLNRKSPETIYEVHKQVVKTKGLKSARYANVNTRMKALEEKGYIKKIGQRETKAGFKAVLYETTSKAYFALLISSLDLDDLIRELDEISILTILGEIVTRK